MTRSDLSGSLNSDTAVPAHRRLNPTQQLFMQRLESLLRKRRQWAALPSADASQTRLINMALYSTYLDLMALGLGEEARALLNSPETPTTG